MLSLNQRLSVAILSAVLLTSSAGIASAQSNNTLQELINQNRISMGRDEVIQQPNPVTTASTVTLVAAPVSDSPTGLLTQSTQMKSGLQKLLEISSQEPNSRR